MAPRARGRKRKAEAEDEPGGDSVGPLVPIGQQQVTPFTRRRTRSASLQPESQQDASSQSQEPERPPPAKRARKASSASTHAPPPPTPARRTRSKKDDTASPLYEGLEPATKAGKKASQRKKRVGTSTSPPPSFTSQPSQLAGTASPTSDTHTEAQQAQHIATQSFESTHATAPISASASAFTFTSGAQNDVGTQATESAQDNGDTEMEEQDTEADQSEVESDATERAQPAAQVEQERTHSQDTESARDTPAAEATSAQEDDDVAETTTAVTTRGSVVEPSFMSTLTDLDVTPDLPTELPTELAQYPAQASSVTQVTQTVTHTVTQQTESPVTVHQNHGAVSRMTYEVLQEDEFLGDLNDDPASQQLAWEAQQASQAVDDDDDESDDVEIIEEQQVVTRTTTTQVVQNESQSSSEDTSSDESSVEEQQIVTRTTSTQVVPNESQSSSNESSSDEPSDESEAENGARVHEVYDEDDAQEGNEEQYYEDGQDAEFIEDDEDDIDLQNARDADADDDVDDDDLFVELAAPAQTATDEAIDPALFAPGFNEFQQAYQSEMAQRRSSSQSNASASAARVPQTFAPSNERQSGSFQVPLEISDDDDEDDVQVVQEPVQESVEVSIQEPVEVVYEEPPAQLTGMHAQDATESFDTMERSLFMGSTEQLPVQEEQQAVAQQPPATPGMSFDFELSSPPFAKNTPDHLLHSTPQIQQHSPTPAVTQVASQVATQIDAQTHEPEVTYVTSGESSNQANSQAAAMLTSIDDEDSLLFGQYAKNKPPASETKMPSDDVVMRTAATQTERSQHSALTQTVNQSSSTASGTHEISTQTEEVETYNVLPSIEQGDIQQPEQSMQSAKSKGKQPEYRANSTSTHSATQSMPQAIAGQSASAPGMHSAADGRTPQPNHRPSYRSVGTQTQSTRPLPRFWPTTDWDDRHDEFDRLTNDEKVCYLVRYQELTETLTDANKTLKEENSRRPPPSWETTHPRVAQAMDFDAQAAVKRIEAEIKRKIAQKGPDEEDRRHADEKAARQKEWQRRYEINKFMSTKPPEASTLARASIPAKAPKPAKVPAPVVEVPPVVMRAQTDDNMSPEERQMYAEMEETKRRADEQNKKALAQARKEQGIIPGGARSGRNQESAEEPADVNMEIDDLVYGDDQEVAQDNMDVYMSGALTAEESEPQQQPQTPTTAPVSRWGFGSIVGSVRRLLPTGWRSAARADTTRLATTTPAAQAASPSDEPGAPQSTTPPGSPTLTQRAFNRPAPITPTPQISKRPRVPQTAPVYRQREADRGQRVTLRQSRRNAEKRAAQQRQKSQQELDRERVKQAHAAIQQTKTPGKRARVNVDEVEGPIQDPRGGFGVFWDEEGNVDSSLVSPDKENQPAQKRRKTDIFGSSVSPGTSKEWQNSGRRSFEPNPDFARSLGVKLDVPANGNVFDQSQRMTAKSAPRKRRRQQLPDLPSTWTDAEREEVVRTGHSDAHPGYWSVPIGSDDDMDTTEGSTEPSQADLSTLPDAPAPAAPTPAPKPQPSRGISEEESNRLLDEMLAKDRDHQRRYDAACRFDRPRRTGFPGLAQKERKEDEQPKTQETPPQAEESKTQEQPEAAANPPQPNNNVFAASSSQASPSKERQFKRPGATARIPKEYQKKKQAEWELKRAQMSLEAAKAKEEEEVAEAKAAEAAIKDAEARQKGLIKGPAPRLTQSSSGWTIKPPPRPTPAHATLPGTQPAQPAAPTSAFGALLEHVRTSEPDPWGKKATTATAPSASAQTQPPVRPPSPDDHYSPTHRVEDVQDDNARSSHAPFKPAAPWASFGHQQAPVAQQPPAATQPAAPVQHAAPSQQPAPLQQPAPSQQPASPSPKKSRTNRATGLLQSKIQEAAAVSDADALTRARYQTDKYKPPQPSGLRASSRLSTSSIASSEDGQQVNGDNPFMFPMAQRLTKYDPVVAAAVQETYQKMGGDKYAAKWFAEEFAKDQIEQQRLNQQNGVNGDMSNTNGNNAATSQSLPA